VVLRTNHFNEMLFQLELFELASLVLLVRRSVQQLCIAHYSLAEIEIEESAAGEQALLLLSYGIE